MSILGATSIQLQMVGTEVEVAMPASDLSTAIRVSVLSGRSVKRMHDNQKQLGRKQP